MMWEQMFVACSYRLGLGTSLKTTHHAGRDGASSAK